MTSRLPVSDWSRLLIPVTGFIGLGIAALLYAIAPEWYFRMLSPFFFFDHPFRYPFLDTEAVLAGIDCWRKGEDVYAGTSCDVQNRPWIYSPLWLRLSFLPIDKSLTMPAGLLLCTAFLMSLRYLPQARGMRDVGLVLFATFSSATVFAMERGNLDLLMFVMAVGAAHCMAGQFGSRLIGYAIIALAGFLKFYPFVVLLALLREHLTRCLAIATALSIALLAFALYYQGELLRSFAGIGWLNTHWGPFSNRFGAAQFPDGIRVLVDGGRR